MTSKCGFGPLLLRDSNASLIGLGISRSYLGGAGWTGMRAERQAILENRQSLEAARFVGRRAAKTALLLRSGTEALGDWVDVDTSWQSMN